MAAKSLSCRVISSHKRSGWDGTDVNILVLIQRIRKAVKRIAKWALIAFAVLLVLGFLVCAEFFFGVAATSEPHTTGDISLPELSGSYPVGRRFIDWVDPSRPDPFYRSERRELVAAVWYPADKTAANRTGTYLPGRRGEIAARLQSMMLRIRFQSYWSAVLRDPIPAHVLRSIQTHAVENAAISTEQVKFPVLLFSPGLGAGPTEYSALLEDIASHGYVVVAVYPVGFVPVTSFESGRNAYASLWSTSLYSLEKDYMVWVRDVLSALDEMVRQNVNPLTPFFGKLDMTRVGAFGHSFGGSASAGACHSDSRIGAGLNLDGGPQGAEAMWRFPQPFMLVQSGGSGKQWDDFLRKSSIGYRAVIHGATHHAFTDEGILPVPEGRRKVKLLGNIGGPRMIQITSSLVCAFFDVALQGRPVGLLSQVSSQFPEVTIESVQK